MDALFEHAGLIQNATLYLITACTAVICWRRARKEER